ncbi:hypothetical protein LCGC14_1430050, partial [marine sediment metagenome]
DKPIDDIGKEVEARRQKEAGAHPPKKSGDNDKGLNSRFIIKCLNANELGDGMLYAAIHKNKYIFNKSTGGWMIWTGHYWDIDHFNRAHANVEGVSDVYLKEAYNIVDRIKQATKQEKDDEVKQLTKLQTRIYKRVRRLREEKGRVNTLKFAHTNQEMAISIKGDELDQQPLLLGTPGGVIELRTGTFRPGRPDDLISIISPIEWQGIDCPAPTWELFLMDVFEKNLELMDFIARLFGYAAAGLNIEHVFPILIGRGRNGKGTIIEIMMHVMGDLAAPISAETLLDQGRARNSAGPSPDIMAFRGLRMAFASETDEDRRFSHSRVKWLTGGDSLTGRQLQSSLVKFETTHTLFLMTNHEPQAQSDDFSFWERVFIIPFNLSYVNREPAADYERPADKHLMEKLKTEGPGILAWLVRGYLAWQQIGIDPPLIVQRATEDYHRNEDVMQDFLDMCCFLEPAQETGASELHSAFAVWWTENMSNRVPSQKKFGKWMRRRFKWEKIGTVRYYGLGLKSEEFGS